MLRLVEEFNDSSFTQRQIIIDTTDKFITVNKLIILVV